MARSTGENPFKFKRSLQKGFKFCVNSFRQFCLALFISLVSTVGILLFLPFKTFACAWAKLYRPDLEHTLTFPSTILDNENICKNVKMNICTVAIFDGPLSVDKLVELFDARVMKKRKSNGEFVYKELSMYWTSFLNYWFWKKDPEFDLRNHVRLYDYGGKAEDFELKLPSGEEGFCDEEHLRQVISPLLAKSWPPKRSPWELLLIQNFRRNAHHGDVGCESKPCSALIFRVHHGICDGYSFIKCMIRDLMKVPIKIQINFPKMNIMERILLCAIVPLKLPWDLAGIVLNSSSSDLTHAKFSGNGITCISKSIDGQLIKRIKNKYRVGYNSVLFSVAAGALKRVMEEVGQEALEELGCFYPLPAPNHPEGLLNLAAGYAFKLNTGQELSSSERLKSIARRMSPSKFYTLPHVTHLINKLSSVFPNCILKMITQVPIDVVMTSIPLTTTQPFFLGCGIQIIDAFFALGPGLEVAGTIVSMGSFNGKQRLLLTADHALVRNNKVLISWGESVEKELTELASLLENESE